MASFDLLTRDLFRTQTCINRNCLSVLPLEPKKKLQKFVIGDSKSVQYWEYKKGELAQAFKSEPLTHDLNRVIISGNEEKATVFISAGSQIIGFTKRGKEFFKLDSQHSEAISHLHVMGQELWSTGKHTLNCYMSTASRIVDKYYYMAEDTIAHMLVVEIVRGSNIGQAVLAVQDKIKVLNDRGQVAYQTQVDSPIVCLDVRPKPTKAGCPLIVYGTKNGNIGAVELTKDEAIVLWETDFTFEKKSGVSLIKVASLSPDEGPNHLIVTRDDSHIEVYTFSQNQAAE